jgi:hypothetical protein
MKIDASPVTTAITKSGNITTISYAGSPLSAATLHAVQVTFSDINSISYTNSWSFTTGHTSLPVTLAGPFTTGGGNALTIFTAAGEGWMGTNYSNAGSSLTLYTRYSIEFSNLNNHPTNLGFGGLQFFICTTEELLTGDNSASTNWSYDAKAWRVQSQYYQQHFWD